MPGAAHPQIDLLGICAVAGNQILPKTLTNTLHVVQHLDLSIPVYAGMDRPMVRDQIIADNIHGETGLDGPIFEPLRISEKSTIIKLFSLFSTHFTKIYKLDNCLFKNKSSEKIGASIREASGIRTPDNLIKSQVLYRLS